MNAHGTFIGGMEGKRNGRGMEKCGCTSVYLNLKACVTRGDLLDLVIQ